MTKTINHSFSANTLSPHVSTSVRESHIDEYVSQRIFKQKSALCRVAMPYILEEPDSPKKIDVKTQLRAVKRKRKAPTQYPLARPNKPFKPMFNYQKTPMNEYLNYELSEQINFGLKEVKILADEIKQIKDEKKKEVMQGEEKRQNKKIRIRPTYFPKKHKHSSSASIR